MHQQLDLRDAVRAATGRSNLGEAFTGTPGDAR
jgi:hypothetical protein